MASHIQKQRNHVYDVTFPSLISPSFLLVFLSVPLVLSPLQQAVEHCSSDLARHYEELQKEYKEAEVEHGSQVHALKQTNEESKRQHQV